ncbi:hypothetical protein EG68_12575 [Paragonimus skrjabini miyazakii]|uniref:Uncharacterized protein n=1 Tax=Paragonimus skrjabini miyazakii TaxID=59628 RepID=A0A8S9YMS8_9TREM|nr:hypothetical protein EG68_12575 [Paragonimus skrjabini miyazakii]
MYYALLAFHAHPPVPSRRSFLFVCSVVGFGVPVDLSLHRILSQINVGFTVHSPLAYHLINHLTFPIDWQVTYLNLCMRIHRECCLESPLL